MPTTRAIPTEVHYMEPVRPRNCRKDRVRENVFLANAEFDCFTEEEAPVALIVKHYGSHYDEETDEMFYECNETPYRLANGKLYTCCEILEDTDRLSLKPYSCKQRGCGTLSEEQLEATIESAYDDLMSRTKLTDY